MSVPHFAFPFRFGQSGSAMTVEQDTQEEIEQNVKVLVLTDRGERMEVPDFGIDDLVFETAIDGSDIIDQARQWDDRVGVRTSEQIDRINATIRHLLIEVEEAED